MSNSRRARSRKWLAQEPLHQLPARIEADRTLGGDDLVVARLAARLDAGSRRGESHGAMSVGASAQCRAMVRLHQDAPVAVLRQRFKQRADDVLIDALERFDF